MTSTKIRYTHLFSPFTLRGLTFENRIWVAPMCQYSATDGVPNDWHIVHLGAFAKGGAGLVLTEATAVTPEGRISLGDTGLWNDKQVDAFARINRFIADQGAVPGIQLAHAGRKASTQLPWEGGASLAPESGGWSTLAPSAVASGDLAGPVAMSEHEIGELVSAFADSARRADRAGFEVVEIHAAHGYLIHQFLSPLSNLRDDEYGGDFHRRTRLLREIVSAVRAVWPQDRPVFVRISATDWAEGGWTVDDSAALAQTLTGFGVDLIDVSSGGLTPEQQITVGPGYQVPLARHIREASPIPVAAVGLITDSAQAEQVLVDGSADAVFLGRALLREPFWPLKAAKELGAEIRWPMPYRSAKYRGSIP
ncbi:NADH:flavin oxidoreductase/NADH oxidase [Rhodococcus globerulus]|uniref:NADH:flavin oxidoreductase/NADH oxidase n=1 Tax=Rhodococcus globerulus TaxID=33008 RepID=UPI001C59DBA5|nr:NADH:flavin oxidoreductase/NADH oxidase [Rhodococcus globerulus]QXW01314.1 NADH:flavin oxidoreductase/NADH oxidase [Rhodococcus globerulus]